MSPISITVEGISQLVNSVKLSTSCGVDNIHSKVLKTHPLRPVIFYVTFSTIFIHWSDSHRLEN